MQYGGHPGESLALRDLAAAHGLLLLEEARMRSAPDRRRARGARPGSRAPTASSRTRISPSARAAMVVCREDETAARAASAALARNDVAVLAASPGPRHELRRRRARPQLPDRRGPLCARLSAGWRGSTTTIARRAAIDALYRERLADVTGLAAALTPPPGAALAHHLFTVVLDAGIDRDAVGASISAAPASRRACTTRPRTGSRSTRLARADLPVTDEMPPGGA